MFEELIGDWGPNIEGQKDLQALLAEEVAAAAQGSAQMVARILDWATSVLSQRDVALAACKLALEDLEMWHSEGLSDLTRQGHYDGTTCEGCATCEKTIPALRAALARAAVEGAGQPCDAAS